MKPLLRSLGSAALVLALLNASAGLCFCHRGPVLPGESPGSAGCCHGPGSSGSVTVNAEGSCCHIESAETAAAPVVVVQLAPPAATVTVVADQTDAADVLPCLAGTLLDRSPPLFTLRI